MLGTLMQSGLSCLSDTCHVLSETTNDHVAAIQPALIRNDASHWP